MRSLVLLAALLSVPGPALAGSFTTISDRAVGADSIISIGVPGPKVAPVQTGPTLAPGSEKIRLKTVDGKTKIYRTEAWLGGSPVTYVTTGTEADLAALKSEGIDIADTGEQLLSPTLKPEPAQTPQLAGVDRNETTGSLNGDGTATPHGKPGAEPAVKPLDADSLKLRPLTNS